MAGITLDAAMQAALVGALVLLGLAAIAFLVVRSIVAKLVSAAVLTVLALVVWSQRDAVEDCADHVRADPSLDASCTFFGQDVTVPR